MEPQQLPITSSVVATAEQSEDDRHRDNGSERQLPEVEVEPDSPLYAWAKRCLDIVISAALLVLLSGVFAVIAVVIKLTSRGPAIYRQKRVGLGGKLFTFYKFRSMYDGADAELHAVRHLNQTGGPTFKSKCDPRVTPVGRFLRKTSLDELPQLYNVLKGDMSLVGPRPPLPDEVREYADGHHRRLSVKPGITCLWQVGGRSDLSFDDQVALDLEYIRKRGLLLDLWILLRTIPAVLSGRGAC